MLLIEYPLQALEAANSGRTNAADGHVQSRGNLGVGGLFRVHVQREEEVPARPTDHRQTVIQPLAQFPVLDGLCVPSSGRDVLVKDRIFADALTTVAFEEAPGVPAGDGGEPPAKLAVLRQLIDALDEDGERKLRYVGGVVGRKPVFPGYGEYDPLVLLQQAPPRIDPAFAAAPDQIAVGRARGGPI